MMMNDYFYHYVSSYFDFLTNTRNYSKNTIITYRNTFLDFINMLKMKKINIDEFLITDLSYDLIMEFIKYLKEEKKNQVVTINNKLATIKSFVKFLKIKNLDTLEICIQIESIKPLRVQERIPDFYSIEEIDYIMKSIDIKENKGLLYLTVITLLYECALRVSELCSLKKKDVINERKTISIFVEKTKNGTSRTLPLDEKSSLIIKKYLEENPMNEDEYLFHTKNNNPYTRFGINKMLTRIIEKIKQNCDDKTYFQKKLHPHIFRHSRATHMLDAGIDLETIKMFLGHKSLKSTEIYLHMTKRKQEEILRKNMLKKNIKIPRSIKEKNDLESYLRKL